MNDFQQRLKAAKAERLEVESKMNRRYAGKTVRNIETSDQGFRIHFDDGSDLWMYHTATSGGMIMVTSDDVHFATLYVNDEKYGDWEQ